MFAHLLAATQAAGFQDWHLLANASHIVSRAPGDHKGTLVAGGHGCGSKLLQSVSMCEHLAGGHKQCGHGTAQHKVSINQEQLQLSAGRAMPTTGSGCSLM